ncbi:transcription initiation factor TFIID subunit 2-like [Asparagus officinalis]|uniref:transcription initiation factor TFIID subunit 2-like n=1 Tax=Asparagus officinalis TaxID=4686 RepID=UPI00098E3758|nr:transcription initiation factor TFIID subunit 2-like [Asparagus officinalis]
MVPCAEPLEPLQSYVVKFDAESGLLCTTVHNDNSSEPDELAFVQPLPMTKMPIPALKGSRAQHGIRLDKKLTVKWAPEVYDPPVSSSSHTVKGHHRHHHHHRSKAKKDHHSHKYSRGKSSKSNVPERKHSSHRRSSTSSLTDPRILRSSRPQPMLNSCGQSKVEPLDLAVGNHAGIMYGGSSRYMELLAPVKLTSF